jgi:hypothetical protein
LAGLEKLDGLLVWGLGRHRPEYGIAFAAAQKHPGGQDFSCPPGISVAAETSHHILLT